MAALTRSLFTSTRQTITSAIYRSYSSSTAYSTSSRLFRLRPLATLLHRVSPLLPTRSFSTTPTNNAVSETTPNSSDPAKGADIKLAGCDFEHWLIMMDEPEGEPTREQIIDTYIKTLATVVGSEEEARMKIYSVSTRHYYAFGALISKELSDKLKDLPNVEWVLPDAYLDINNESYGGEPFVNGVAKPYDPKYHKEWLRNKALANERNKQSNDRSGDSSRRRRQGSPR